MPETVAIALSGGIDSMVSAALLKERGYPLIGLHFITGFESGFHSDPDADPGSLMVQTRKQLEPMTSRLGVPLYIIDLRREFQKGVVDYFVTTYQSGKTPNPCLVCNPLIKFEILFNKARAMGAKRIATGHYARIEKADDGRYHLFRGIDQSKDQSYFLSLLTQTQLGRAVLPLGAFTKDQTRRMAAQRGLKAAAVEESQDICFIKNGSYGDFLQRQPGFEFYPGAIENEMGRQIGRHSGLHTFTIGQRRGINCPAAEPYYVIKIDRRRNTLTVGPKSSLLTRTCKVGEINWIIPLPQGEIRVAARVRYRHAAVPARLVPMGETAAELVFDEAQAAVTPGQGAVFYRGEEVLGGGWIQ